MQKIFLGLVAAGILAADLVSKWAVGMHIEPYGVVAVGPGFNLVHIYNRGVTFGLFSSGVAYAPYLLALLGMGIIAMLCRWMMKAEGAPQRIALSSIIGGAASNVLDRLHDGAVTDFLDLYIGAYHWPAFNLADVFIVCGVATLLLDATILNGRQRRRMRLLGD